jgi:hypothetical protein
VPRLGSCVTSTGVQPESVDVDEQSITGGL